VRRGVRRDFDAALWAEDLVLLPELVAGAAQVSDVSKDPTATSTSPKPPRVTPRSS
jgi:hypothetical protein